MALADPARDEKLSLNHPVIDPRHQDILHKVHDLPRRDAPNVDQSIRCLLRYFFDQFRDEEVLMSCNAPPTGWHNR